jgi:hypothetical protein
MEDQTDDAFSNLRELSDRTADAMQSNFSDLFYDAVTGELKTFEEYATAVFESVARAWSDMMGQMLAQSLFGGNFKGGGLLDSLLGALGGAAGGAGGGTTPSYTTTWSPRAGGGPVYPGGTYLVGEQGPELLTMGGNSGSITPNGAIGGGSTQVNVTINAVDAKSVQQLLTENKNLITGMVGSEAMRNQSFRSNIRAAAR